MVESIAISAGADELLPYHVRHDVHEARHLFDAGTLSAVTRYVRQLDAIPGPLVNAWTILTKFQPMAELRVLPEATEFIVQSGIGAHDRLFVHIGRSVNRRALVIASHDIVPGTVRHFVARVLEPETDERGPLLLVRDRNPPHVLAARETVRVECVIFNRPDVLCEPPTKFF